MKELFFIIFLEVVMHAIAIIFFLFAIFFAYLAIKVWLIPKDEYELFRVGLGKTLKQVVFGDNPKAPEYSPFEQTQGLVINKKRKAIPKRSYTEQSLERLLNG